MLSPIAHDVELTGSGFKVNSLREPFTIQNVHGEVVVPVPIPVPCSGCSVVHDEDDVSRAVQAQSSSAGRASMHAQH